MDIEEKIHNACDEVELGEKSGIVDIFEQFIGEGGVHDREEYILKNEESGQIPLGTETSFTVESRKGNLERPIDVVHSNKCHLCEYSASEGSELDAHEQPTDYRVEAATENLLCDIDHRQHQFLKG